MLHVDIWCVLSIIYAASIFSTTRLKFRDCRWRALMRRDNNRNGDDELCLPICRPSRRYFHAFATVRFNKRILSPSAILNCRKRQSTANYEYSLLRPALAVIAQRPLQIKTTGGFRHEISYEIASIIEILMRDITWDKLIEHQAPAYIMRRDTLYFRFLSPATKYCELFEIGVMLLFMLNVLCLLTLMAMR